MDFAPSRKVREFQDKLSAFMETYVYPAEAVAHEGECDERSEGRRDDARENGDLETHANRAPEPRIVERVEPVLERKALPCVVEAAERVVERERDHDRYRQHQIDESEQRVHRQDVVFDERPDPSEWTLARPTDF